MNELNENSSVNPITEEKSLSNNQEKTQQNLTEINDKQKRKNKTTNIIPFACILVVLLLALALKVVTSSPKNILKSTINNGYKMVQKYAKEIDKSKEKFDLKKKAVVFSGDIKFDGNIEELDMDLSDYKLGFEFGIKPSTEQLTTKASITKNGETADFKIFFDEEGNYLTSSLFDGTVELDGVENDFSEIFEALNKINEKNIQFTEFTEIGKYIIKAINKNLEKDAIKKEHVEIEIDDKTVKVNKITYDLSGKKASKLIKAVLKELKDNDKFIERTVKLVNDIAEEDILKKSELKNQIEDLIDEVKDAEVPKNTSISIYTQGVFNKFVGGCIEVAKETVLDAYITEKRSEIVVNDGEEKIKLTANKEGKETKIVVKQNKTTLVEATVREFSQEKIDLDWTIFNEEEAIKGNIYLTCKETKNATSGEYKVNLTYEEETYEISGSYTIESKNDLGKIDKENVTTLDELDLEEIRKNAYKVLDEEIVDEMINSIEGEIYDYNIIDMIALQEEKEAMETTKKKKAVLYIGSTYYSSYSNKEAATLLESLTDLQSELNFHSYFLNESKAKENFFTNIGEVDTVCKIKKEETGEIPVEGQEEKENPSTCQTTPVIYLIKDGKVVKAIQGEIEKEELKNYLSEIGY